MNKSKLYFGLIGVFLITLLSGAYANENQNVNQKDSLVLIENTITQNLIMQGQNGISPQNLVFDEKNMVFYVINTKNNSLDIIDYSLNDSLRFVNKISLSDFGKIPVAVAYSKNIVAVTINKEIELDSSNVVFFNEKGEFIKVFSVAPFVKSILFDPSGEKVYVSNSNTSGYKINVIDISKGIENATGANITTITYQKEKAGDAFIKLDPYGFGMAIIAMSVVFSALVFLYIVFKYIGKLNTSQSRKKALIKKGKVVEASKIIEDPAGDVYAVIALALYMYQSQLHDEENTVITMEKVARSYSPWNSKIYGLRQTPTN